MVEGRGLHESFDAIVSAVPHFDAAGIVAVDQRAAVEIETEAVFAGTGAIGGEAAVDVMREAGTFGLVPVHWKIFEVAEIVFLEIEGAEDAVDVGGLGEGAEGEEGDEQGDERSEKRVARRDEDQ